VESSQPQSQSESQSQSQSQSESQSESPELVSSLQAEETPKKLAQGALAIAHAALTSAQAAVGLAMQASSPKASAVAAATVRAKEAAARSKELQELDRCSICDLPDPSLAHVAAKLKHATKVCRCEHFPLALPAGCAFGDAVVAPIDAQDTTACYVLWYAHIYIGIHCIIYILTLVDYSLRNSGTRLLAPSGART
jgi:hypothetical protein